MEKALAAIHQGFPAISSLVIGYGIHGGELGLFLETDPSFARPFFAPIEANYPDCSIVATEREELNSGTETWRSSVRLAPDLFPVLRHSQFEDLLNRNYADPVGTLLGTLSSIGIDASLKMTIHPASKSRCNRANRAIRLLDREFFRSHHRIAKFFSRIALSRRWWIFACVLSHFAMRTPSPTHTSVETTGSRMHDREDDLQAASDKIGGHLFDVSMQIIVRVPTDHRQKAFEAIQAISGALGAFTKSRLSTFQAARPTNRLRGNDWPKFLMSHEELATIWHPATSTVQAERMRTTEFRELEGPLEFHSEKERGVAVLGRVRFRGDDREIVLGCEDRRRHLYVVGKTGMGKTTLLQNMISHDISNGMGLCLVDPHGDLAETIGGLIPSHRTNDVILFDAASRECSVGFNPLSCNDRNRIDQVTSGVVSAFKKLHDSWGPRLEDTLRNAVFAIVEQGGNLLSVMRLLGERNFREAAVVNIRDEIVRSFWMHEFSSWSDNYRTEAVAAIQNKLRPLLTSTNIRNIVCNPKNCIDLRQIMDYGKILIVNLSKGRLGEDNSTLLGAFLVTCIQQAAMTRADIPEADRRDFLLYVDEFQNFTTGSFASVLSEARKFRLSLIIAHQYLSQLDEPTANAVFGNVGSIVSFQVGSDDAELLTQQLGKFPGQIGPENLTGLPKFTAYARLLIDGLPSNPFSMQTLPPTGTFDPERAEIVRRVSRRRFAASSTTADVAEFSLVG